MNKPSNKGFLSMIWEPNNCSPHNKLVDIDYTNKMKINYHINLSIQWPDFGMPIKNIY
jgi:glutathionylspermidine synthase